jgi:hypothetical protein
VSDQPGMSGASTASSPSGMIGAAIMVGWSSLGA